MNLEFQDEVKAISGSSIKEVELIPDLIGHKQLIKDTCEYFFKVNLLMESFPFKGFILEGPPGTGKTELIRQVTKSLSKNLNVYFLFIDGATIAAPKWGEAENRLRQTFKYISTLEKETHDPKLIILFDDIESLMISRGADLAKEWHYSINSILFHEIDTLNPTNTLICATTNRIDLVDDAIKTRLYPLKIDSVSMESLNSVVKEILDASIHNQGDKDFVENLIVEQLEQMNKPTIRDARQITVVECIKNRVWKV
jgi:SpoVK/Ycf46/Vps4 family AAA+-type ATPase